MLPFLPLAGFPMLVPPLPGDVKGEGTAALKVVMSVVGPVGMSRGSGCSAS